MGRIFINPNNILGWELPLIAFSDHTSGFVEFLIKFRTRASYNHCMWMTYPGEFASQGNVFSQVPISRYMRKGSRLKFFKPILTYDQRVAIRTLINSDLRKPWYRRLYDWPGIVGQLFGIKWFNSPIKSNRFCSENVAYYLDRVFPDSIPKHASPGELNEFFKKDDRFELFGYFIGD